MDPNSKNDPTSDDESGASDRSEPMRSDEAEAERAAAVEAVIRRFGGIRPMASKVNIPVTTVQGWKRRGAIPLQRHAEIIAAAEHRGVLLDPAELAASASPDDRAEDRVDSPETLEGVAEPMRPADEEYGREDEREATYAAEIERAEAEQAGAEPGPWAAERHAEEEIRTPADRRDPAHDHLEEEVRAPEASGFREGGEEAYRPEERAHGAAPTEERPLAAQEPEAERGEAAAPPRKRGGGVAWLAALVAIVGAGVAVTAPYWAADVLPAEVVGEPSVPALADRLDRLEEQLAAVPTGEGPVPAQERLDSLESQLSQLRQDLQDLPSVPAGAPGAVADLGPVTERLDTLDQRVADLAEQPPAIDPARIDELSRDLAGLRSSVEALRRLEEELAGVQGRLQDLSSTVGSVQGTTAQLSSRIDQLGQGVEGEVSRLTERLDGVSARIQTLSAQLDRLQTLDVDAQATILAIGELRDALERGQPFSGILPTLSRLVSDQPAAAEALESLTPYGERGIPTRVDLDARFGDMAEAVLQAAVEADGGGVLDRVRSQVQGLVSVRPVAGEVEGDSIDAMLARGEDRLDRGNLRGAVEALEGLEGAPADAAEPWLTDARARLAAEDAIATLTGSTIEELTGRAAAVRQAEVGQGGNGEDGAAP